MFDGTAAEADPAALRLPFAFSGISLHATAATALHVQLTRTGADTFRLYAADPAGAPVISIDTVTLRALPERIVSRPRWRAAGQRVGAGLVAGARDTSARSGAAATGVGGGVPRSPSGCRRACSGGPIHTELATLASVPGSGDLAVAAARSGQPTRRLILCGGCTA